MHSILAARSNFSIGESILSVERLVDAAAAAGAKALALTDTMGVTGMIDFTNRCKKKGIKPIIGTRLRLVDDHTWRKPPKKEGKSKTPTEYFLTYYVLSEKGLKALFRLLSLANDEAHFYNNAKLSFSDLYAELATLTGDDAAIASSDVYSVFHHVDAIKILDKIKSLLSARNVFATLTPINTPLFDTLNRKALSSGFPTLVTRPVCYDKDEADATDVMNAICSNTLLSSLWAKSPEFRDLHPMANAEFTLACGKAIQRLIKRGVDPKQTNMVFIEGLQNTNALVDMVKFEWTKQPVSLPVMAPNEFDAVRAKCMAGFKERFSKVTFGHKPSREELATVYFERLKYELTVLKKLNFSGYFLLVEDVVSYAKSQGILVGPGRGSVGGSLVAYLMGITDCDPIRFGLLFERFINPDRIDLPDADLDFMSERRHEIVKYLIEKYGQERVAGVTNFGTLGPASAIRDCGKMFGLDERAYNCSKFTPKLHGAHVKLEDAAELVAEIGIFRDTFPPVWETCLKLEGVMRNLGQHAAGIVVGGCDLKERAVIEHRKGGEHVVNWDKRIVEDQGLVKMDILGLSTLDIIALTTQYIRERHASKRVDLMAIPLDDPKVLEQFASGQTVGVFQFESGGMRRLLKNLGKDGVITFDDITAATALYRPGPMESGMMDSFWKRKSGEEAIEYDHSLLEPVLSETYGVFVYQEEVMQASRVIAGYSAPDADKLRKIMGKKLPEEMKKERGKFVAGCIATIGCDEEWAGLLFDKIEGFAGYGFNKSHSVEYTLISYQCMWLKTYFPIEFYAATLSIVGEDKIPPLLNDAMRFGVVVDLPEINTATDRFEILTDTRVMIPLGRIKGLSVKAAQSIVAARKDPVTGAHKRFESKADFIARVDRRLVHAGKQDVLSRIGAFAAIEPADLPIDAPARIKDQREFLPGLIVSIVPIHREIALGETEIRSLKVLYDKMLKEVSADGTPVHPYIGKAAQFVIVFDAPTSEEEKENMMFLSNPARRPFALERTQESMDAAGLRPEQAYWTAILKRPKAGKSIAPAEIKLYQPFFDAELDIIKSPIIVLMGSQAVRYFCPDFKGRASEEAGKIIYDPKRDANLVIGFGPGEIWHDPDKQEKLDEVFAAVNMLLS